MKCAFQKHNLYAKIERQLNHRKWSVKPQISGNQKEWKIKVRTKDKDIKHKTEAAWTLVVQRHKLKGVIREDHNSAQLCALCRAEDQASFFETLTSESALVFPTEWLVVLTASFPWSHPILSLLRCHILVLISSQSHNDLEKQIASLTASRPRNKYPSFANALLVFMT